MPVNSATLFLSAVTSEFDAVREDLRQVLSLPGVRCETQKSFLAFGNRTLVELNNYVRDCDAVVHLVGRETGSVPKAAELQELQQLHPDLSERLNLPSTTLARMTYTQWEAWLAIYHRIKLLIAPRKGSVPTPGVAAATGANSSPVLSQSEHLALLAETGRFPDEKLVFQRSEELSIALLRSLRTLLPAVQQPIANLPPSIGSLFKGRDEKLAELRQLLRSDRQAGAVGTAIVAIAGTGGFGKTQLATEYAHLFAHEHSALLFMSAATPELLEDNLAGLAGALRLHAATMQNREQQIRAVLDWLADPAYAHWLLIIDNIDTLEAMTAVLTRLKQLHHGHVVLTSRVRHWPQYVRTLNLPVLSPEAATQYLLERTKDERIAVSGDPADDQEVAQQLVRRLGFMALAVNQAAATIVQRGMSIADYLQEWQSNQNELLDDPLFDEQQTGYPRTMAASCLTSLKQLSALQRFVFDGLCLLGHAAIPERLLHGPWSPEASSALPDELRAQQPKRGTDILLPIYKFSLADRPHDAERLLSIHNVIQDATRRWQQELPTDEQLRRRRFAEAIVQADFVRPDTINNQTLTILPQLRQMEPHVTQLLESPLAPHPFAARCRRVLGAMCWTVGQNADAVQHLQQAATAAEIDLRQHQPDNALELARILNLLIFVRNQMGDRDHLLELCEKALLLTAEWRNHSDSEYCRAYADSCQETGRVHASLGDHQQALPLLEQAAEVHRQLLEKDPLNLQHKRELGIAYDNIGRIAQSQGRFDEAADCFAKHRDICLLLLEKDPLNLQHKRDLGIAYDNIGRIAQSQGRFDEAAECFAKDRDIFLLLLEKDPLNLQHKRSLGIAYSYIGRIAQSQGRFDEAADCFAKYRDTFLLLLEKDPLNLEHKRELGIAYHNIGRIAQSQGRFDEAADCFAKCRDTFLLLLEKDPLNLEHKRSLGIAYDNIGQIRQLLGASEEALDAFVQSSQIDRELLAKDPQNAVIRQDFTVVLCRLAPLYRQLGYPQRAASVLREAEAMLQALSLPQHNVNTEWAVRTLQDVRRQLQQLETRNP